MSIFLRQQDLSVVDVDQEKLKFAAYQYDTMSKLQKTVFHDCAMKCVPLDYGEGDLAKGESTCTDRCVAKFMQSYKLLGDYCREQQLSPSDLKYYEELKRRIS